MKKLVTLIRLLILAFIWLCGNSLQAVQNFALVIGISGYPNFPGGEELKYAHKDAEEFAKFLKSPACGEFAEANIKVIPRMEATRDGILDGLKWLDDNVQSNSKVYVFFSGHALPVDKGNVYLIPYGVPKASPERGIAINEFFDRIVELPVSRAILFMDACHSSAAANPRGAKGEGSTSRAISKAWEKENQENKLPVAFAFFSASSNQKAFEHEKAGGGHGVFTHFLLEGLRGKAKKRDSNTPAEYISSEDLYRYVLDEVQAFTKKYIRVLQTPAKSPGFDPNIVMASLTKMEGTTMTPVPTNDSSQAEEAARALVARELALRSLFVGTSNAQKTSAELKITLANIQGSLKSAGLYEGEVDGIPGPKTTAAIISWQETSQLQATGTLDSKTINSLKKADSSRYTNTLNMKFVRVPGLDVLVSIWETRNRDYQAYCAAEGIDHRDIGLIQNDLHPVVRVSYEEARAFCKWLSKKENRRYRLPTDAEWSQFVGLSNEQGETPAEKSYYAAKVYPWGGDFPPPPKVANLATGGDEFEDTAPVGRHGPSKFGLYDISGNVWEWCGTKFNAPQMPSAYVVRGGGWGDPNEVAARSGHRYWADRNHVASDSIGFRVVLDPSAGSER